MKRQVHRTVQTVLSDHEGRRTGIVRALTADVEAFCQRCTALGPESLVLQAYPDGSWAVQPIDADVPPNSPEPSMGLGCMRCPGLEQKDWLQLVALHSDAWLMGLACFEAAMFSREQRLELFARINKLPTCLEEVSGRAKGYDAGGKQGKVKMDMDDSEEEEEEEDDSDSDWADGEGDPCPMCQKPYRQNTFWIACDKCNKWFCGRCAKVTAEKAKRLRKWKCIPCSNE